MTWVQGVGGAKRLRVTAWVLGCGAEEAAAQPGSGGGSRTRTVKPNSGSTAGSSQEAEGGPAHAR